MSPRIFEEATEFLRRLEIFGIDFYRQSDFSRSMGFLSRYCVITFCITQDIFKSNTRFLSGF